MKILLKTSECLILTVAANSKTENFKYKLLHSFIKFSHFLMVAFKKFIEKNFGKMQEATDHDTGDLRYRRQFLSLLKTKLQTLMLKQEFYPEINHN